MEKLWYFDIHDETVPVCIRALIWTRFPDAHNGSVFHVDEETIAEMMEEEKYDVDESRENFKKRMVINLTHGNTTLRREELETLPTHTLEEAIDEHRRWRAENGIGPEETILVEIWW